MTLMDPQRQYDRLPPHNAEAEQCTISAMILAVDPKEFTGVVEIVDRDHFFQTDHQILFDAIVDIRKKGPCDVPIMRDWLKKHGVYDEIGGAEYLGRILHAMPSAAHGPHYAKIVRNAYVLRRCIAAANDVLRVAYGRQSDGSELAIATEAVREFSTIAADGETQKITKLSEAVDHVIDRKESATVYRVPTGMIELDNAIGGLPLGKFTMVGGRPGMGKSLLLKQILRNIAKTGRPVGVITIEENQIKIAENCLSAESGIDNYKIAFQNFSPEEWNAVARARMSLEELPFFIADYPVRLREVENAISRLVAEHGCQIIAIDYIQLIDGGEINENREITMVSRAVKSAFKRLNVAGIAAVQLNRGNEQGETRWPALKDLRGSGSLEQDGDIIILLHSEDYYRRQKGDPERDNKLMLLVRKNKDGCQADIPVYLAQATQEIRDWNETSIFDGERI